MLSYRCDFGRVIEFRFVGRNRANVGYQLHTMDDAGGFDLVQTDPAYDSSAIFQQELSSTAVSARFGVLMVAATMGDDEVPVDFTVEQDGGEIPPEVFHQEEIDATLPIKLKAGRPSWFEFKILKAI